MPVETKVWVCEYCRAPFIKKEEAEECEKWHSAPDKLVVSDARIFESHNRFPNKILIADKTHSGVLAEYYKYTESSMEDFYEKKPWNEISEDNESLSFKEPEF